MAPGEIVVTTIPQADGKSSRVMMLVQHSGVPVDNSFEHAVRRALDGAGQRSAVVAGKVQLQGLDEIRATAGNRWITLSDRMFDMAESILRDHLGPADVFSRTADDGFLICFVELDETEAKTRAHAIASEIREKLVAEFPDLAETEVSDFVTSVEVDAADVMPENAIVNALEARLTRERKRLEDIAFKTMRTTLTTAEVVFQAVRSEPVQPTPILMTRLQPHVEAAQSSLLALGRSEYVAKTEALMLTGAVERVQAELAQPRNELILTPIRLTALIHKRDADHWLSIARGLDGEAKKRLMVEVRELSRDTPRARLSEVTMLIASLFRGIAFELPTIDPGFIAHLPVSASLATIDARLLPENATVPVARLMKALLPRRCRLIVKNVASASMTLALTQAGVSLIATAETGTQ
jgi:GGDEF domain-containing protein